MNGSHPLHPVVMDMANEWHKVAALLMQSMGITHFEITADLVKQLSTTHQNIVADCRGGKFILRLVNDEQANALMRGEAGGN